MKDWQKQKQQGACSNKRTVSSSSEGDKCDIGASLSLEKQEASGWWFTLLLTDDSRCDGHSPMR